MILDALLEFDISTGVAITVTRDSTNILDMAAQRDMGVGDFTLAILVSIITAFTAAGAATLTTEVKASADNVTYYSLASTIAEAVANLTIGRQLARWPLPLFDEVAANSGLNAPRYYKLTYTVATGPMTAGTIAAYLTGHESRDANRPYAKGFDTSQI